MFHPSFGFNQRAIQAYERLIQYRFEQQLKRIKRNTAKRAKRRRGKGKRR